MRPRRAFVAAALLAILGGGVYLRVRHMGYGLPYAYSHDETGHFTNRAVAMLGGDLDPHYYQNPSGFTYLCYVVMRATYGALGIHLDQGVISRQFFADSSPIFELTRGLTTALAMAGAAAVFWVGRRVWDTAVGLAAAAVLTFAFLPVAYSRVAVTDVGTFLPVTLALYGALRMRERGCRRDYLLAGAAAGLGVGFKYTVALLIVPVALAAAMRLRDEPDPVERRRRLSGIALGGLALVAAFAVTTPYLFVHPGDALHQIGDQAVTAGRTVKLGQSREGGFAFYARSLTWGLGWAALAAALAGAAVELRRDRARGAMLLAFPLALFVYMGSQSRYFGRWMLPMYPVLALLAGVAIVWLARRVRGRPAARALVGAAALAAVLVQPLAADLRTSNVLGREDTRQVVRDYLVSHYPPGLRVVIEPAVPWNYYAVPGHLDGSRQFVRQEANAGAASGTSSSYVGTLRPALIDDYRRTGFCLVATMSVIRGRAENAGLPAALAYYARLRAESTLVLHASPYKPGRTPVPLDYDFSYDYYPTAYERPGPDVRLYRLRDCRQGYGRVEAPVIRRERARDSGGGRFPARPSGTGARSGQTSRINKKPLPRQGVAPWSAPSRGGGPPYAPAGT